MFLVFFFVPETAYNRAPIEQLLDTTHITRSEKHGDVSTEEKSNSVDQQSTEKKQTYLRSLRFISGKYSTAPFWKILVRPVVMFWYPAVLWAFLIYGTTFTWIVVFSVVNASIFTAPPYNFSVSQTGLISLSPFVMTIVGELIAGPLNDYICLFLAKRNHGIYEPEFRLVLMVPVFLLGITGFFGFGAAVHYQTHWSGPVLTFGLANMSMAFANGCVFGYVIDSYEDLSEEGNHGLPTPSDLTSRVGKMLIDYLAFVAINARNLLTFGLTYFVNNWLERDGMLAVFNVLGSCFIGVCVLTLPLWVFGKRLRGVIARNEELGRFMRD